jgi:LemA protein
MPYAYNSLPVLPIIILGILFFLIIWVIAIYNSLVKLRLQCRDSWSGIDTELKRRYDLIPNLVATVSAYASHERQTLSLVTEARAKAVASTGSPHSQAIDENVLISTLQRLFGIVENYPDLKASGNFLKLQSELVETEDRIQAARRFYNGNVRDLNTKIESFPSNIIASAFNFQKEDFFEIDSLSFRSATQVSF